MRARTPPVQHILRGGYKLGLHAFQGGQRHHGRFSTPEEEKGTGEWGQATVGESALATPLWGMHYADATGVVSQSPEQLRKMMGVIVVVCAAFGLTVSEAKTEIMCLRAKRMPESTATLSVDAAGQVYNQTSEFVYLEGNINQMTTCPSRSTGAYATHGAALEVRPPTVRPTFASLELKIRMLRSEVLEKMLYGCVT